jgi:hypothetical protein
MTFDTNILKMYEIEISKVSDHVVDPFILSSLRKLNRICSVPFKIAFAAVDKPYIKSILYFIDIN